jgi:hypothetical protein
MAMAMEARMPQLQHRSTRYRVDGRARRHPWYNIDRFVRGTLISGTLLHTGVSYTQAIMPTFTNPLTTGGVAESGLAIKI